MKVGDARTIVVGVIMELLHNLFRNINPNVSLVYHSIQKRERERESDFSHKKNGKRFCCRGRIA
jgi:hypothetical protein